MALGLLSLYLGIGFHNRSVASKRLGAHDIEGEGDVDKAHDDPGLKASRVLRFQRFESRHITILERFGTSSPHLNRVYRVA